MSESKGKKFAFNKKFNSRFRKKTKSLEFEQFKCKTQNEKPTRYKSLKTSEELLNFDLASCLFKPNERSNQF